MIMSIRKRILILFVVFFSAICTSGLFAGYDFFDFKSSKPLFLFLEAGFSNSGDEPIEIEENTLLDLAWNVSGSLIFVSNDKIRNKKYNGIQTAYLNSISKSDWNQIKFKIKSSWKDKSGKTHSKDIIEGDFNDPAVRKEENDTFSDDDSAYVRDYKFSIILNNMDYKFTMPLAPETYKLVVEVSYPVMVWKVVNGIFKRVKIGSMTSRSKAREVLVKDITPPEIEVENGLEKSSERCTTGDPLPDGVADISIIINDNNPNAEISDVVFDSIDKSYTFAAASVKRNYDEDAPQRFIGIYKLKIPNREGDILTTSGDASPLKYSITVSDSAGNSGNIEAEIPNYDNDPPNVKFIFNNISAIIKKEDFDPIDSKGKMEIDMLDLSSRKVLYVDEFISTDPLPVILKTDKIVVKQHTRVLFQAFAFDNSDKNPNITMNGQRISDEGKRFIFTDNSKTETVLETADKAGNKRKIIIPIKVRKMYFNTHTIQNQKSR